VSGDHGPGGREPAPTDPAPTDPAPTDPAPTDPAASLLLRALGPAGAVADLDEAVRLLRDTSPPEGEFERARQQCLLGMALSLRGMLYPGEPAPTPDPGSPGPDLAEAMSLLQQGMQALDRLAAEAATPEQREPVAGFADRMRIWQAMTTLSGAADPSGLARVLHGVRLGGGAPQPLPDAAPESDAGPLPDAAPESDAGPEPDVGPESDAGPDVEVDLTGVPAVAPSPDTLAAVRALLSGVPDQFPGDPSLSSLVGVLHAAVDALAAEDGPEGLPVLLDAFRRVAEQSEFSAVPVPAWMRRQTTIGIADLLGIRPDLLDHRDATIADLRRSLDELPATHPARADLLIALGRLRMLDFLGRRRLEAVREAQALLAEAVDVLPGDDPRRLEAQEGVGQAGSLAVLAGGTPEEVAAGREALDRVIDRSTGPPDAADSSRLVAQVAAQAWQALRTGDLSGLGRAVGRALEDLVAKSAEQAAPDPDVVRLLSMAIFLGLTVRGSVTGELHQLELGGAIGRWLDEGEETVVLPGLGSLDQVTRSVALASRLDAVIRDGTVDGGGTGDELADLARELTALADELPEDSPMLNITVHGLGLAELLIGVRCNQMQRVDAGLAAMREASLSLDPAFPLTAEMTALTGGLAAGLALHLPDEEVAARWAEDGIGLLRTAIAAAPDEPDRARLGMLLGELLTARERCRASAGHDPDTDTLGEAVRLLQLAWDDVAGLPARPQAARIGAGLAQALRTAAAACAPVADPGAGVADAAGGTVAGRAEARERARRIGESALCLRGRDVLLQTGTRRALRSARDGADEALRLAHWCLADGDPEGAVRALEAGRGLVLAATTAGDEVDRLLRAGGQQRLADRWAASRETRRDLPAPGCVTVGEGAATTPGALDVGGTDRWAEALRAALGEVVGAHVRDDLSLRHEVLTAVDTIAGDGWWSLRWGPAEVAAVVREAGLDALVYLVPQRRDQESYLEHAESTEGTVLVVAPDAGVRVLPCPGLVVDGSSPLLGFADEEGHVDPAALRRACDWAGEQVMGPLLDHLEVVVTGTGPQVDGVRLVLVPVGELAVVPWHAARTVGHPSRYACRRAVIGYAASARQLAESLAAPAPAPGVPPVLLASPASSPVLPWASQAALAVRAAVYPTARLLGRLGSGVPVAGSGTGEEVLDALGSGVPLLELACHARSEPDPQRCVLSLADGPLTLERILAHARSARARGGGLVLLSACSSAITRADHDEALALASGLLAAGSGAVIGTRWDVGDAAAAVFSVVLNHLLADQRIPDTMTALAAAQRWVLDPDRTPLGSAPAWFASLLAGLSDPDDPAAAVSWAAFAHHGAPRCPVVRTVPGDAVG
jgi:hypothetical protein